MCESILRLGVESLHTRVSDPPPVLLIGPSLSYNQLAGRLVDGLTLMVAGSRILGNALETDAYGRAFESGKETTTNRSYGFLFFFFLFFLLGFVFRTAGW